MRERYKRLHPDERMAFWSLVSFVVGLAVMIGDEGGTGGQLLVVQSTVLICTSMILGAIRRSVPSLHFHMHRPEESKPDAAFDWSAIGVPDHETDKPN